MNSQDKLLYIQHEFLQYACKKQQLKTTLGKWMTSCFFANPLLHRKHKLLLLVYNFALKYAIASELYLQHMHAYEMTDITIFAMNEIAWFAAYCYT